MPDSPLASLTAKTAGAAALIYGVVSPYAAGDDRKISMTAAGAVLLEAANAEAQRTALGLGTIATQAASAVAITGGTLAGLTGLGIRSTGAAFDLTLASSEALTAGRTLSFNVGNADRTLTIPATGTAALLGTANVFTTLQTITQANANTGILASTGYSLTGSNATNMIDLAGTWNTTGTPTAIKLNITNTASNAASKWLDLQSSGTSIFGIAYTAGSFGTTINVVNSAGTALTLFDGGVGRARIAHDFTGSVWLGSVSTDVYIGANSGSAVVQTGYQGSAIFWCNTLRIGSGSTDTLLVRKAAAALQLGADAAGVTNQMFTAANRITSDGVGANLTIAPGNGRGAAGGDLILSHWTTGGAGIVGTLTTSLTINVSGITASAKIIGSASTTTRATLNIPSGTAPTSPVDGDIWSDGSDLKVRLGGATYTLTKA